MTGGNLARDEQTLGRALFDRQWLHLILLVSLLVPVGLLSRLPSGTEGALWGWSARTWFWVVVLTAVLHQSYVWLTWRLELHAGLLTRVFRDAAFPLFKAGFAVLALSRLLILPLAVANRGTLQLPGVVRWGASAAFLALSGYLFYSVLRYFGIDRATGADHFDPEARAWPLVDEGIFRYTSNGMYVFGFLLLWVPGLALESFGALVAAAFHHAYIWIHYHCTEKPDMEFIYVGSNPR
jgi:hypothetical protein